MLFDSKNLKLVSQGSNSEIYRFGKSPRSYILKMVPSSSKKEVKHLTNEYEMLGGLNHENIIKAFKHKTKIVTQGINGCELGKFKDVLVLEDAMHGNLLDWVKKAAPNISQIRWVSAELCQGIRYLHCNFIVHRDLKLENVLVSQNSHKIQIKLSDFGFSSKVKENPMSQEYKGTRRAYMSPEIHSLMRDASKQYDTYKADIFALGVMLFSLVFGRLPFEFATPQNTYYRHIASDQEEEFWNSHLIGRDLKGAQIQDFKEIFMTMVHPNPALRPSIEEILGCTWLQGQQQIVTINST